MRNTATIGLTLLVACAAVLAAQSASAAFAPPANSWDELYRYVARPAGDDREERREHVEIGFRYDEEGTFIRSSTIVGGNFENVFVRIGPEGTFRSAYRVGELGGTTAMDGSIWFDDGTVSVTTEGKIEEGEREVPEGVPVAADVSLLHLMRSFPFGTDAAWEVLMADFSGNFVTVSIRNAGTDSVSVPAGVFLCHRMDVAVRILIFRPTITFWLAADPPHFLVKHRGKRGPFTRTYTTELVAGE